MSKSAFTSFIIVVVLGVLLAASAFVVKETEKVVITQFGEVVRLVEAPGLNFKIPFVQDIKRLEKRWLEWDGDPNQITTLDKRYIYIDVFARWRISDPMVFIETLRDETSAQGRLDDIIDNATRNVIANHKLIELIRSTNREFEHDAEEAALSIREDEMMDDESPPDEDTPEGTPADVEGAAEETSVAESDTAGDPEEAASKADVTSPAGPEADGREPEVGGGEKPTDAEASAGGGEPPEDGKEDVDKAEEGEALPEAPIRKTTRRPNLYATELGREKLTRLVLDKASSKAAQLGIEIKDVQIKRIDYIESVQAKVFDRMISERKRVAESYRSEGQGRSAEILGKMEMELQQIQSEAYRESQIIMGRADAKAADTYAKAYKKNPEFYRFTKTMESYQETVDESAWLLLSTDADFVHYMKSMR